MAAYAEVTYSQRRWTMPGDKIGSREEWQAARDELAKLEASTRSSARR